MFILDLPKLRAGDIVLQAGDTKFSKLIKVGTKSDYSHAMLYLGKSIIHALTDGVYSINPQRIIVEKEEELIVLRHKNRLNQNQSNSIIQFTRNKVGSLYSIPEAGASFFLGNTKKEAITNKQFCSRLVAQAYTNAGVPIVNNSNYCSPADIYKSEVLIQLDEVTRVALDEEIKFAKSDDPIKENRRRAYDWLNKTRDTFNEVGVEIQTESDVLEALASHPYLDEKISRYIKDSGYLSHYSFDTEVNPYRYNFNAFRKYIKSQDEELNLLCSGIDLEKGEIVRHSIDYFRSGSNYIQFGLEYFKLREELYRNLLRLSLARLEVLKQYSKFIREHKLVEICDFQIQYLQKLI